MIFSPEMVLAIATLIGVIFNGLIGFRVGRKTDKVERKVDENTSITSNVDRAVNGGGAPLRAEIVALKAEVARLNLLAKRKEGA
jgi:hypothetical protein